MDIDKIRQIVNAGYSKDVCEQAIIEVIATDTKAVDSVLYLLSAERRQKRELLLDTNEKLSIAFVALKQYEEGNRVVKATKMLRNSVIERIIEHYHKWKDVISCNFNIKGLPDYKE